jgi:hypothetical protein
MEYNDEEIIEVIKQLMDGKGDDEQIEFWSGHQLRGLDEVYDLIFYPEEKLTPEEILKRARALSKPICL